MTLDFTQLLVLSDGVHVRRFDADLIVLDLQHGNYFTLNELGAVIVERSVGGKALDTIVEELLDEYDVTRERLVADVEALVHDLELRGLVRIGAPVAPSAGRS